MSLYRPGLPQSCISCKICNSCKMSCKSCILLWLQDSSLFFLPIFFGYLYINIFKGFNLYFLLFNFIFCYENCKLLNFIFLLKKSWTWKNFQLILLKNIFLQSQFFFCILTYKDPLSENVCKFPKII